MAAGRLVRTWGFLERQGRVPAADVLATALATSGMRHVELDSEGRRIRFRQPGVELTPGAIGKGWAIDRVIERLAAAGVPSVLVHGGSSSVRARGVQGPAVPGRRGWRVGLRHPLRPGRRLATLTLVDQALGTSGSGTQFFVDRGRRIGHILDPRTGRPAEGVLAATVIAPAAADADALATALYVLGPEGLPRIAPAGGGVGGVVIVPGATAGVVVLKTANLPADMLTIESQEGVVVEEVA
jgi:thiamine biosynthesis lipoprotein